MRMKYCSSFSKDYTLSSLPGPSTEGPELFCKIFKVKLKSKCVFMFMCLYI